MELRAALPSLLTPRNATVHSPVSIDRTDMRRVEREGGSATCGWFSSVPLDAGSCQHNINN